MTMFFADMPEWLDYLIRGIFIFILMCATCVVASRAGRSPYWSLLAIVPYTLVVLVWVFACTRWPKVDKTDVPPTT